MPHTASVIEKNTLKCNYPILHMKKTLKKRRKIQIPHNATVIWGKVKINSQQNGGFWSPVHAR
jgi:hypothetical protein